MKILIDKKLWNNFVRRAKKRFPKEYIECIWGKQTKTTFTILKFSKVPHTATRCSITYDSNELDKQHKLAQAENLKCLGSCHTHPFYIDCSPSQVDHEESIRLGEKVMGILALNKTKKGHLIPYIKWWFPQSTLQFIQED